MKSANYKNYDYIIAGGGCAGLSLAMHLKKSNLKFDRVLVVDKVAKTANDRTWCFWTDQKNNWFDEIVYRKWNEFSFKSPGYKERFSISPYNYQMIRGIDFYNYCLDNLRADKRFELVNDTIVRIKCDSQFAYLQCLENEYTSEYLFNSVFSTLKSKKNDVDYVQHFKGWLVKTETNLFDTSCPTFMDFDIDQENDCRFVYILPIEKNVALVEYTGFSESFITELEYDQRLKSYMEKLGPGKTYEILETEKGNIPMTEYKFINPYGKRVINIGTAGGAAKPSTGYTFSFIQKHCKQIIERIEKNRAPLEFKRKGRFTVYDKIFLDVLREKTITSAELFTQFFKTEKANHLLAFLNEESNIRQEFNIIKSLEKRPFLNSAFRKLT